MRNDELVICIPTKRPPPVKTLLSYSSNIYPVLIICDPDVYEAHRGYVYTGEIPSTISVVQGRRGMGAQSAECYVQADKFSYPYFFRMDDDLAPRTFVQHQALGVPPDTGRFPSLDYVIGEAVRCMEATKTTLVGFSNTSNVHWLGQGRVYKRTYGLVHGGANLSISHPRPSPLFIDDTLARGEDVYRTCAHRLWDSKRDGQKGRVGRVQHIGFDKRGSTITAGQSSISATEEQVLASRDLILERFKGMVTCEGVRYVDDGRTPIANWRMRP